MAVITPFLKDWPFFCYFPSNDTSSLITRSCPSFTILCISFAESNTLLGVITINLMEYIIYSIMWFFWLIVTTYSLNDRTSWYLQGFFRSHKKQKYFEYWGHITFYHILNLVLIIGKMFQLNTSNYKRYISVYCVTKSNSLIRNLTFHKRID